MSNVKINLTLVGVEDFSASDRQRVNNCIVTMRSIYLAVGLHLTIDRFTMSRAQAGALVNIASSSDARALTEKAAGPDGGVDMFVVKTMVNAEGWSPVGGPCSKKAKGMTGVVVSLNGSDANAGNSFAHELGHYLGLPHCPCSDPACNDNFIRGQGGCNSNSNTAITPAQGSIIANHCFVTP